jgi:hypothetical protein
MFRLWLASGRKADTRIHDMPAAGSDAPAGSMLDRRARPFMNGCVLLRAFYHWHLDVNCTLTNVSECFSEYILT